MGIETETNRWFPEYGGVAQMGEHLPCKQGVRSSILLVSTKYCTLKTSQKKQKVLAFDENVRHL